MKPAFGGLNGSSDAPIHKRTGILLLVNWAGRSIHPREARHRVARRTSSSSYFRSSPFLRFSCKTIFSVTSAASTLPAIIKLECFQPSSGRVIPWS
jgi:hypothetical protein